MKKLVLLLLIGFSAISCDLGDDNTAEFVLSPVQDVTMASTYKVDSISEILVRYKRPSDCYVFQGYYYNAQDTVRTCAIEFARINASDCQDDPTVYEIPLRFKPRYAGNYLFRFWDGTNTDGTDHYFEAEAVVNN